MFCWSDFCEMKDDLLWSSRLPVVPAETGVLDGLEDGVTGGTVAEVRLSNRSESHHQSIENQFQVRHT